MAKIETINDVLRNLKGIDFVDIKINDQAFNTLDEAIEAFGDHEGTISINFNTSKIEVKDVVKGPAVTYTVESDKENETLYRIMVKAYMTKPPCPEFDFHRKWNGGVPMPLRIMTGRKLQETKGMVKMECWGEMLEDIQETCMKCGRAITNPISKYFGMGPECGGHGYRANDTITAEIKEAIERNKQMLKDIRWTGWIIKSSIIKERTL